MPAEDVDALEAALHRLLTDDDFAAECRRNVEQVADEYRWSRVLEPLADFCRTAERAADSFSLQPPMRDTAGPSVLAGLSPKVQRKLLAARAARSEGGYLLLLRRSLGWVRRRLSAAAPR